MGCFFKRLKGIAITNVFQKVLNEFDRKPSKIWVEKGSEFYNRSMTSLLQNNDRKVSIYNKGKYAAVERLIRTFKNKIYKYMTSVSKSV